MEGFLWTGLHCIRLLEEVESFASPLPAMALPRAQRAVQLDGVALGGLRGIPASKTAAHREEGA
eukprot:301786-Pyramimonas_sp.AAC.1